MDSDVVEFKDKKLKAIPCEPFECEGCFFDNSGLMMCNNMNCQAHTRDDNQDVIFVEVIDHSKTLLPADEFDDLVSKLEDNSKEPTQLMREILELSLEGTFKVKKVKHD